MTLKSTAQKNARKGFIQTFELLLLLPIVVLLLLAFVEYLYLAYAETLVSLAAREGARTAAMGGNEGDVKGAVLAVLGPNWMASIESEVDLLYPNGDPSVTGDPVQVTVNLLASTVAPNFLAPLGFDLNSVKVTSKTTMVLE